MGSPIFPVSYTHLDVYKRQTICARFDHSKVESTESFSDIHGHWAEKFVERAAALGWVNGYMDGTFCPNATTVSYTHLQS